MKRPRRPVKKQREEISAPAPTEKVLVSNVHQIAAPRGGGFEWMAYPSTETEQKQLEERGVRPVAYADFGGVLPGKDGFVHFQGMTLVHLPDRVTTTSMLGHRILVVSLTISEKI